METVAQLVARRLHASTGRVFGLQGGHIQPIWDELAQLGVQIVDVRDEGAAVHMAHAHSVLTGGLGVALATAGPGVLNCVTAMANARLERARVLLIGGCAPRPQEFMGPLQGVDHVSVLAPVTRLSRTLRVADNVIPELDSAIATANGHGAAPGPVYLELPTDVLRETVHPDVVLAEHMRDRPPPALLPDPASVDAAVALLAEAERPLLISGRGALGAAAELAQLLEATGAAYLDTQESRGLLPPGSDAQVGAVRARAMKEADVVVVVGRKLDYQVAYGSPAVFTGSRLIRIAGNPEELRDNRRGEVEILATPRLAMSAIAARASMPRLDRAWLAGLRSAHAERSARYAESLAATAAGSDGRIHPNRIFAALRRVLRPDAIAIADGGDLLSFARTGLEVGTYLDSGTFGCLGVGVPYGVAAALAHPDRQVVVVTGDGAFGINAMELDTAHRHGARAVFIVSNNAAWNIERYDQQENYGGRVVGTVLEWSDYSQLARGLRLHAERVEDANRLEAAIEEAFAKAPALLDVVTTREAVSSDAGKGLGWVPDRQALTAWDEAERARRR